MGQKTHCDYCNTAIYGEHYNLHLTLVKIEEVKETGSAPKKEKKPILKKYYTDICNNCQMQVQNFFNYLGQVKEAEKQGL